jgi:hypothetical protein
MVGRSPTIEIHDWSFDLHTPLDNMRFPRLRALSLLIQARPEPTNASTLAALLEHMSTPCNVIALPRAPGPLAQELYLPALRSLLCANVLLGSPGAVGLCLLPLCGLLGPVCDVTAMAQMYGSALRALDVARFESIALLVRAVRLFARLR